MNALSRSVRGSAVLITGAASSMGRAAATVFAAEGASVAVTDRDERASCARRCRTCDVHPRGASSTSPPPRRWRRRSKDSIYCAAKRGVLVLTRAMALELGHDRITVNCICPGPIHTGMTAGIADQDKDTFARRHPALRSYG